MDAKASARAKHASSQRGRARHSTRKHQPQQKQQQQQAAIDPQHPQDKRDLDLPSNWSRYEEVVEQDDCLSDVPSVKSKGANYRDLLSEKSMLQGPDFASGRKGLMITRGLDLWSRFADMDNLWSINEVSGEEDNFFTLDLDFLNKELAKIDIAERLMVDAKYIPLSERKKSESEHKNAGAEIAKTVLNLASRTSSDNSGFTKSPALSSPQEIYGLHSSISTEEAGRGGSFDSRFLEKADAASEMKKGHADSFINKESETPDGSLHSVSKEPLGQLPKTTNLFDAKSAEAELDALLDMLDNKSSVVESFGLARRAVSGSEGSYPDPLQGYKPVYIRVDTSGMATLHPNVGASIDNPLHMTGSTKSAVKVGSVSSHAPADPVKSVPKLDEDLDDWLDSL